MPAQHATVWESRGFPSGLSSLPGPNEQPAAVWGPCQAGGNLLQLDQSNRLQLRRSSHVEQEGCLVSRNRRQGLQVWRQCQGNHCFCISKAERFVLAQEQL